MERLIEFKGVSTTLFVSAVLAQYLQVDTLNIEVETDIPRTIILPDYSALININLRINVVDKTGNANVNNITIQRNAAPDLINGATSVVINTNYGYSQITGATLNKTKQWACLFGGATSSSTGGGGGGTVSGLLEFDLTISAARAIQIFNDPTQFETLVAAPAPNQIIQLVCSNFLLYFKTKPFDNNPLMGISSIASTAAGLLHVPNYQLFSFDFGLNNVFTPSSMGGIPYGNSGGVYLPNGGINNAPELLLPTNGGLYLINARSLSYGVTQGDSDVRVYGLYRIKTVL